ncbi:MAG: hypothetical protein KME30_04100 [Iphinoe sp. HA4291-MV1]|jgi:hypothetical protein|nr:hypothetical protein [Iphinoe sp. HA4291-MV1]
MAGQSNIRLTIALEESDLEAEELARQTRSFLREIKDLDEVEQASLVAVAETPEGAKALLGDFLPGRLQTQVSVANFKKFLRFLAERLGNKTIEIEVEANGKKLKVKASSQQELLVTIQSAQQFVAAEKDIADEKGSTANWG